MNFSVKKKLIVSALMGSIVLFASISKADSYTYTTIDIPGSIGTTIN